MKLSKKSRYGIRALIDLMVFGLEGKVTIASIAKRNNISLQFLEQVFSAMKRGGIVNSIKGPNGGYYLASDPTLITLHQVITAIEGDYLLEEEADFSERKEDIIIEVLQTTVINQLNRQTEALLKSLTLADLRKDYNDIAGLDVDMYYI